MLVNDCKLNYTKVLENSKSQEYSYVNALANPDELNQLLRKRIAKKNIYYDYFLNESEDIHSVKPLSQQ
jgi:hypothetical protein